jgi:hypothetical protein
LGTWVCIPSLNTSTPHPVRSGRHRLLLLIVEDCSSSLQYGQSQRPETLEWSWVGTAGITKLTVSEMCLETSRCARNRCLLLIKTESQAGSGEIHVWRDFLLGAAWYWCD